MSKWAIITGATSGIGLELARYFARGGYDIVAIARRENELHSLKKELNGRWETNVKTLALDLSRQNSAEKVWDYCQKHKIEPEILVNNAGFGDLTEFTDSDWDKQLRMINLNVVSLTALTRIFAPGMALRGKGHILNLGSTASFVPGPFMSVYHATKWYVDGFSHSLREELRGTNVSVTAAYPPPTATGFQKQAHQEKSRFFSRRDKMMTAHEVAHILYEDTLAGKAQSLPGLKTKFIKVSGWLTPKTIASRIIAKVYTQQVKP